MDNKETINEYEDPDEQDDYSSASFRARSNTWPLNKPDLALPSSGVCIDETLPEIELEDDDLFTTNENWSTGLVDQDIMSWDPILNVQSQQQQPQPQQQQPQPQPHQHQHHHHQQQQQQQQTAQPHQSSQQTVTNLPETVHHHHQPQQQHPQQHPHHHHQQQQQAQSHTIHQLNHHPQQQHPPVQMIHGHHRHQSIHTQNHQPHHQHHLHHHHEPQHQHLIPSQQQQPRPDPHQQTQNDIYIDAANSSKNIILTSQNVVQMGPHHQAQQLQQRLSPSQHPTHVHHQTLNSVHCLDSDDPTEYHIQQMHHLSLENNPHSHEGSQQDHYGPTLNSMCILNPSANLNNDTSYNISANHQNHHQQQLQPLTSATYEMDPRGDYELKAHHDDTLSHQTIEHQAMNHRPHHKHPQLIQQHPHHRHHDDEQHQQSHHHQIQTASSSLDNHSGGSQMLSSSLSTSGIGLSGDLEDLDYGHAIDHSNILPPYDDQQNQTETQQQQQQKTTSSDAANNDTKQSDSTPPTSKTKLIAPRRNAWGNMSYADLISQAIDSTSDKRLTLSQIYDWMVQHVPYFKDKGDSNSSAGWKNSVRHNLSLHSRFKRLQNEGTGKSSWWTINPEANIGKCARRRAASMEASKYEKKRGRAKKKAEAIRQGLISYPSLSNSSLNGSSTALGQQDSQAQSVNQFHTTLPASSQPPEQSQPQLQNLDQFATRPPIQTLDQYLIDHPSQQQQQHLQQLQQSDAAQDRDDHNNPPTHDQNLFMISSQQPLQQQHLEPRYEENNENSKIQQQQQHQQSQPPPQQQQSQQQQSQYYYPFELSTAL